MIYSALQEAALARHLSILGGFHPRPSDDVPTDCKTILLLGPDEPAFWPAFRASPEATDGAPDPMDRWSRRVIGDWAETLNAQPLYPFGGPPFLPFYSWALRSGRVHASPVQFLVHDTAGLMVSFRGALALTEEVALAAPPPPPCDTCASQPCLTACPVGALTAEGYDVPACKSYLDSRAGTACLTGGCRVRTICPVSQRFGRLPAQSEYHMRQFTGA
ncbi:ferredoxin [Sulfitobacter alexandrii]|uniref:Ferredoxin n=1 Tax=Sulfitobacter alexandrii TaxID=1917485 RepID=A0A1J0WDH9_9RHOB|nr:ferredoxin [Sulfitobacter alexandrii]APE42355.1 ferredoxin [Sulfitobacter alexandrii]